MIAGGLHIVLNPLFTERSNRIAEGNRVTASPSHLEALLALLFTEWTAAKLFRDERHAADCAELKTSAVFDITSGAVLQCGRLRRSWNGILDRKGLDNQLRFAVGTSSQVCGTNGRAVVTDLRQRGFTRSSGQRGS